MVSIIGYHLRRRHINMAMNSSCNSQLSSWQDYIDDASRPASVYYRVRTVHSQQLGARPLQLGLHACTFLMVTLLLVPFSFCKSNTL